MDAKQNTSSIQYGNGGMQEFGAIPNGTFFRQGDKVGMKVSNAEFYNNSMILPSDGGPPKGTQIGQAELVIPVNVELTVRVL